MRSYTVWGLCMREEGWLFVQDLRRSRPAHGPDTLGPRRRWRKVFGRGCFCFLLGRILFRNKKVGGSPSYLVCLCNMHMIYIYIYIHIYIHLYIYGQDLQYTYWLHIYIYIYLFIDLSYWTVIETWLSLTSFKWWWPILFGASQPFLFNGFFDGKDKYDFHQVNQWKFLERQPV